MTVALTKINSFVEKIAEKTFNLGSDTLKVALTNTAHTASWSQLSDLTEISYTNLSDRTLTVSSSSQSSGIYKLVLNDLTLTASGGAIPTFRYVYVYDDTASNKELIGYYDYGMGITLQDNDSFVIDFDATNGVFQLT